ncbi:dihydrouridine synthase domain-containing protein, putative [Eimeria tenella]|uniref:Dihydrouridine synthase domain-containing protein, putative n=1 Tax=Eimeria tenella TaxID=5802 RepID=U6KSE9_EIMTE|nr:dihydrouridine synthase domain-containing protein, putative [Eimeria tenella]CDJ41032.1 dihydrouridine synthase domain-containing protein, putative [Eimeria tenella]|eukprot:XP_013231782.1 dihydrouridine synthase domain-containing protein, putative [Eimeria tenella]
MHQQLSIPVTCKIRKVLTAPDSTAYDGLRASAAAAAAPAAAAAAAAERQLDRLLSYALEAAVIANGGVETKEDAVRCLKVTGADAVMAAEGILDNPSLFAGAAALLQQQLLQQLAPSWQPPAVRLGVLSEADLSPPPSSSSSCSSSSSSSCGVSAWQRVCLMKRYLDICGVYTPPHSGCAKAHLFRCLHPILAAAPNWRDTLHQSSCMEDLLALMDCIYNHFAATSSSSSSSDSSSSNSNTWYRRHRRGTEKDEETEEATDKEAAAAADPCSLAAEGFEGLFG